jgi:manganese/zinc/iron transport system substrate-binding protein
VTVRRSIFGTALILLYLVLTVTACKQTGQKSASSTDGTAKKLKVTTTVGMIGYAAERIGGDHVEVRALMGPGVDPHLYKASEGDVQALAGTDVVLYGGLHLEAKLADLLEKLADTRTAVAVAESIPEDRLLGSENFAGMHDPHVWFDVELWKYAVSAVGDTLAKADAANAADYAANAEAYLAELDELHAYVKGRAAEVEESQRVLVTAHDAFRYFGRAYGFEVVGLQGISTESQAGTADVQKLAELIAKRKIRAIFVESSVPVRNIEAVREAVKSRGWEVTIGGELFSDAMGDAGTPEGTYPGMVRHNIDTIVDALKQ